MQRVPKTNGEIPSFDEAFSDHRRLLDKLVLYGLVELTVNGDDNCQFWALSDQFYRTPEHRRFVRQQVVNQGFGGDADGRREVHGLGGVVDADVRRGEAAACHLPLAPQHTGKQSIRHPEHER
uniref:OTU domain-containing protein n=1 Tax=Aegilops tauschii subsp. strangulata TaxID=200361 RepID=A0A453PQR2_AEGTS